MPNWATGIVIPKRRFKRYDSKNPYRDSYEEKRKNSEEIAKQTEEFLSRGGKITKCEMGETGNQTMLKLTERQLKRSGMTKNLKVY